MKLGKGRKVKPLAWTAPRVERWRETGQVPGRVMVWGAAQCGEFLDGIEGDRLYALYHLAAYFGLRRSELAGLCWPDVDLATRRVHVRQAQVEDELDDTKSEDSERIISIDEGTADRAAGVAESPDRRADRVGGHVDGQRAGVHPRVRDAAAALGGFYHPSPRWSPGSACPRSGFHDLRHGAATMLLAAGEPPKVISDMLGHATVAFTMDVYAEVAEELANAAGGMTPEEAEELLIEWAEVARDRDNRVRAAVGAGVSKHRVHALTGIGRSTIDRILAALRPPAGHHGPSGGENDH